MEGNLWNRNVDFSVRDDEAFVLRLVEMKIARFHTDFG